MYPIPEQPGQLSSSKMKLGSHVHILVLVLSLVLQISLCLGGTGPLHAAMICCYHCTNQ